MKKSLIKNICIATCVTTFFVMLFMIIYGYVINPIVKKELINDAARFVETEEEQKYYREEIESFQGENGPVEYQKRIIEIMFNSKELVYEDLLMAMVASVIIGSIFGYIKTMMESNIDKKSLVKKVVLTYTVGLLIVTIGTIIIQRVGGSFDPEAIGLYALNYTIVYVVCSIVLVARDIITKNKLNKLIKKSE